MNNTMITRGSLIAISLTALTLGVVNGFVYVITKRTHWTKVYRTQILCFKNENLEVEVGDVRVKATGRITMEVVQILSEILRSTESNVFPEEYSPYIPPLGRQTMKRHDNFLPTMY